MIYLRTERTGEVLAYSIYLVLRYSKKILLNSFSLTLLMKSCSNFTYLTFLRNNKMNFSNKDLNNLLMNLTFRIINPSST